MTKSEAFYHDYHYYMRFSFNKFVETLDTSIINDKDNPSRTFMHYFYSICMIGQETYLVKLGVDELNSRSGDIRRAYNVNNIKISPIAVSRVYKPAGTMGDMGDSISNISITDLYGFVKSY